MATQQAAKRPKAQFKNKEKVLLVFQWGETVFKETRYVKGRPTWNGKTWVYVVGSTLNPRLNMGKSTVAETSLSKHP